MSRRILFVVALTATLTGVAIQQTAGAEQDVIISGVAKDCTPTQAIHVAGVSVWAFDPVANQAIAELLRSMDSIDVEADFNSALDSLNVAYWKLDTLLTTSSSLARDSTDLTGAFRMIVPPRDTALIVAHTVAEGEPFYYAYKLVSARSDTSIVIDMSHGQCGF